MVVRITKPTSMPGEVTTIVAYHVNEGIKNDQLKVGNLRLSLGRQGKAIDWRIRQENDRKLADTRKRLQKHGVKIPGFGLH
jgi:hypothetical protein